jgi:hypothetical protein
VQVEVRPSSCFLPTALLDEKVPAKKWGVTLNVYAPREEKLALEKLTFT